MDCQYIHYRQAFIMNIFICQSACFESKEKQGEIKLRRLRTLLLLPSMLYGVCELLCRHPQQGSRQSMM